MSIALNQPRISDPDPRGERIGVRLVDALERLEVAGIPESAVRERFQRQNPYRDFDDIRSQIAEANLVDSITTSDLVALCDCAAITLDWLLAGDATAGMRPYGHLATGILDSLYPERTR